MPARLHRWALSIDALWANVEHEALGPASARLFAATGATAGPFELGASDLDRVVAGGPHDEGGSGGAGRCGEEGTLPSLGFGNSGYGGHVGFFDRGRQNIGVGNDGRQNVGVLNRGRENRRLGNRGEGNIGLGNKGSGNIGVGLTGEGWVGFGPIKISRQPRS